MAIMAGVAEASLVFVLNETIVQAVARLVDDAKTERREPSHSDLEDWIRRAGLVAADPHSDVAVRVGKQKRVRSVLRWSMDNDQAAGTLATTQFIGMLVGFGGFRKDSPNYCGEDPVATCMAAFAGTPVELTEDGILRPRSLEGLAGRNLTVALRSYVLRAQRGYEDSVLVAGTDKDLIEAAAAHVLTERYGTYTPQSFPTLLAQAFIALGLAPQKSKPELGGLDGAREAMSTSFYDLGCAVNRMRNKAGAGHGRPFDPGLSEAEVRAATEAAGLIAGLMLDVLGQ